LDNGTELKAYRLRRPNGGSDPWSAVYWIDAQGQYHSVYADAFEWQTLSTWTSPHTALRYPTEVKILATNPTSKQSETYHLRPKLADQEFTGNDSSNAYWEGACDVFDAQGERIGQAYLELAGYGDGLGGKLN
jgi:predicted secreted hydrolase